MEFAYEGGGLGKGGAVELFVDGEVVGKGTVTGTAAMVFSADDTCNVGKEGGALVADDYPVPNDFTGQINWVESDVAEAAENTDHLISPEERLRIAMARRPDVRERGSSSHLLVLGSFGIIVRRDSGRSA
jgi:arylsulfatase